MTQDMTIIWLDLTQTRDSQCYVSLCKIDPFLISYRNTQKCLDYVLNLKDDAKRVILIISMNEVFTSSDTVIQEYIQTTQIEFIYILCNSTKVNIAKFDKLNKVCGIYTDRFLLWNELSLLHSVRRQRREDFRYMDFLMTTYDMSDCSSKTSTTTSSQQKKDSPYSSMNELMFLFSKILRDIVLEDNEPSRDEMINICRQKYAHYPTELNQIEEFAEYYKSSDAILWFTRDIFLYRLINKSIREQEIEIFYSLRYFIRDLHNRLNERYISQRSSLSLNTVYRGQLMDDVTFNEKIRNNLGGLFSMGSFLSTTRDRLLAMTFAGYDHSNRISKEQCVLFQISFDITIDKFSYADISNESVFGESEKEVLFTMGTLFRIISITQENDENIWIVQLKLSDEEDKHVEQMNPTIKKCFTGPSKPLIKLIRILCMMYRFESAEHLSLSALEDNSITSDLHLLLQIYDPLSILYKNNENPNEALTYFKRILQIKHKQGVSFEDPSLTHFYTNLGNVYEDIDDHYDAHTYHNLALRTLFNAEKIHQEDLAIKYSNLASICRKKGLYSEALQNYTICLDIELEILPFDDHRLLITKNNLGVIYIHLNNSTKAIEHFQELIQTGEHFFPHPTLNLNLALVYWNLACAFYQQRELTQALQYLTKSFEIFNNEKLSAFDDLNNKECIKWIQRIEGEQLKQLHSIPKGYGPQPLSVCHPSFIRFSFQ